jgi:hypothetical protein
VTTSVDLIAVPVDQLPSTHPDARPEPRKRRQLSGAEFALAFIGAFCALFALAMTLGMLTAR